MRVVPMLGVPAVHVIMYSAPSTSLMANAIMMPLHATREIFFFITSLVLFLSTNPSSRSQSWISFWGRRLPTILVPYLAWTLIYSVISSGLAWPLWPTLTGLGTNLIQGWFHLYFLLVTMQFYILFPLLWWLLRKSSRFHAPIIIASAALQMVVTGLIQYDWDIFGDKLQMWFGEAQLEVTSYQFYFILGGITALRWQELRELLTRHRRLAAGLSLFGLVAGEAFYPFNLLLGQKPGDAAGVFQPALLLITVGAVLGIWIIGESWIGSHQPSGRLWRGIRYLATASFGIYLAHMLPLVVITQAPVLGVLPTDKLPWAVATAARYGIVMVFTLLLTALVMRSRLSRALAGRRSHSWQRPATPALEATGSLS
jgi:peptidoglycan/LPS O-acetylase OafA/YrhL